MDWNEHSVVYCPRKEGSLGKKGKMVGEEEGMGGKEEDIVDCWTQSSPVQNI